MNRLVFDITHVIGHLKRNKRLTGIQRVELNVIKAATELIGEQSVSVLIQNRGGIGYHINTTSPLVQANLDAAMLADIIKHFTQLQQGFFPDKLTLKQHLDVFKKNKIKRSYKKASIYIQCFLNRGGLVKQGILMPEGDGRTDYIPQSPLSPTDTYICLGTGWLDHRKVNILATHHANGGKTIQMIHDLIPIVRPDLHMPWVTRAFRDWLQDIASYTDLFICVSQNTQRDLNRFLEDNSISTKTAVAPLAHEFLGFERGGSNTNPPPQLRECIRTLRDKSFIVCVGTIEIRKNGANLLRAWREVCRSKPEAKDYSLIFAGKRSWGLNDFDKALLTCKQENIDVRIIEDACDSEIAWLYGHCYFSVYPSLYEGWGLPIGESLWFNRPCLSSNTSSMPEVGGTLVQYCDPESTTSIATGLLALLDPSTNSAAERVIIGAPLRRWQDHVADVLALIPR